MTVAVDRVSVADAVRRGYQVGLCLLKVKPDGSKAPDVSRWKSFKEERPTVAQMRGAHIDAWVGFGMIAGPVSGHRECWDFDTADVCEDFDAAAEACGLGDLVRRIRAGYEDHTPGGGRRWIVEYPETVTWEDCTLARRPKRPEERQHEHDDTKVLIELPTFSILAPSNGPTHPTGRPYVHRSGDLTTIATYTADERAALIALARSFDQIPAREHAPTKPSTRPSVDLTPGDDFNQRAAWSDVVPDWTVVYHRGDITYLRRPGKTFGTSATINALGTDRLHVFTSSSAFERDTSYSKFGAYALLQHGGDFVQAAAALRQQGYGQATTDDPWRAADLDSSRSTDLEARIADEVTRQRVFREARRRVDADERGPITDPAFLTLRERLACPSVATRWRIAGWQPAQARVLMAAQFKAGKTTLVGGLLRSLADNVPWLGRAIVTPLDGTVALLDNEMSPRQLDDWLRDQRIHQDDRVIVVPLRGQVATLDLLDARQRTRWAGWLRDRQVTYLVLDCLRPVLDAFGLDEHREAGRFLTALDALLAEAGIPDALVVQHMGHLNERARGDSRLRDWPDVEWRLVRQDDAPASPRFITAYGRDVDIPESRLDYDPLTRRLTVAGGSRQDAKVAAALAAVQDVLQTATTPLSGRAIKTALADSGHPRDTVDAALRHGLQARVLRFEDGARQSKLYRVSECPGVSGGCPADSECECPAASIEADTHTQSPPSRQSPSGPDTHDDLPPCLVALTDPDDRDPLGAHDDEPPARGARWQGRRPGPDAPPDGISPEAWARHHRTRKRT